MLKNCGISLDSVKEDVEEAIYPVFDGVGVNFYVSFLTFSMSICCGEAPYKPLSILNVGHIGIDTGDIASFLGNSPYAQEKESPRIGTNKRLFL